MIIKANIFKFSFPIISIFLISCGGGGGGTSSAISNTTEGAYLTEYNNQWGLGKIGAKTANDNGYTGSGVRVAVVDSGVNGSHEEFNQTSQTGRNFSGVTTALTDGNGHGTHVASIIAGERDGSGMRGVAYDAEIWSYKIFNDSTPAVATGVSTDSKWASMVNYHVTDSIKVSNNSWGNTAVEVNETSQSEITSVYARTVGAYQDAVSNGTIFVWATGNNARIQPSWQAGMPYHIDDIEDGWLAVMAVDEDLQEPLYTQRCGLAAAWCVAAPGGGDTGSTEGIYAAKSSGGYVKYSGTSMAAPHVSGLLATVIDRFPSLSASAIRNRVLTTATYSGLTDFAGNAATSLSSSDRQAIFGQGLVTYNAATSTLGTLQYVIGENYYSPDKVIDVESSNISIPSFLGRNTNMMNDSFTVFDSFDGANFEVKGSDIFEFNSYDNQLSLNNKSQITKINNIDSNNSLFGLNFISSGGNNTTLISDDFWDKKSGFFAQSNSLTNKNLNNFNFKIFNSKDFEISHFYQVEESGSSESLEGMGLRVIKDFENISFLTSVSETKIPINLSFIENNSSESVQANLELGLIYNFSDNLDFFYRDYKSKLENTSSSPINFGLTDGEMSTRTLGLTYLSKEKDLELGFGFFQPHILTNGEISFNKVSGRNPDGSIYYETVNYDVNQNSDFMPMFLSTSKILDDDVTIQFSLQQSNHDPDMIGVGEAKFIKQF